MACVYDHHNSSKARERLEPHESRIEDLESSEKSEISASSINTLDFSESRERRLRELKLLQHYSTKTSKSLLGGTSTATENWSIYLPNLAFKSDALLNSLLSLSALHLAKTEPNEAESEEAYRNYLDLAVRGHSQDIAHACKENADVLCLTSGLLRVCAFAALQERSLSPYAPPMQWLQMTHGTGRVFHAVWQWISDDETSIAMRMLNRSPKLTPFNEELWAEDNRQGFQYLLHRSQADTANEPWSSSVQEAYNTTLSYIGSVQIAITAGEAPEDICRRLIVFPLLISKEFINLVEEQQPRALVVLAHYFALLAKFKDDIWYIGDAGQREVRGIHTILPVEWQDRMSKPLQIMESVPLVPL